MKLSLRTETSAFERNVAALAAALRKTANDTVRDVSVMVLQTGASLTPQAKKSKREIVRAVRRYRRGVEEIVRGGRVEAPGDRMLYMIRRPRNRRPQSRSGDRRWWVFESAREAQDYQPITFRGVGKAGFWSQLPALGQPIPRKYAAVAYLADVPGLYSTAGDLQGAMPVVELVNKARSIQDKSFMKAAILQKVNNRIAGAARSRADRLVRYYEAGGVMYDSGIDNYDFGGDV